MLKKSLVLTALLLATPALATPGTVTSPTGGALPAGVTQIGGVVVDLKGANGTRVVSQLAASQLYRGFADSSQNPVAGVASGNPLLFGTQTGFSPAVIAALGGGLSALSVRITLYDGDTAGGNFDFNKNLFYVNGTQLGNWSNVNTLETNADGTGILSSGTGFGDNMLSTGFFSSTNAVSLASIFSSMSSTNALAFTLSDSTPFDNFYDFTRGVNGGLINVGQGPVITPTNPAVPEPATWMMMILGMGAVGFAMRRQKQQLARVNFAF